MGGWGPPTGLDPFVSRLLTSMCPTGLELPGSDGIGLPSPLVGISAQVEKCKLWQHRFIFPVMAISGVSSGSGYQPPPKKKSKTLNCEANRGESYKSSTQPGRVSLSQISWHPSTRGGQGILPMHAHVVAKSICDQGTSIRRYISVRLVEVPEPQKEA